MDVRSIIVDNTPCFVHKDVALALGYKDTSDALKKYVHEDDRLTRRFADSGQNRNMIVINESGLYSMILGQEHIAICSKENPPVIVPEG